MRSSRTFLARSFWNRASSDCATRKRGLLRIPPEGSIPTRFEKSDRAGGDLIQPGSLKLRKPITDGNVLDQYKRLWLGSPDPSSHNFSQARFWRLNVQRECPSPAGQYLARYPEVRRLERDTIVVKSLTVKGLVFPESLDCWQAALEVLPQ
jgi:hypothetical protein